MALEMTNIHLDTMEEGNQKSMSAVIESPTKYVTPKKNIGTTSASK